MQLKIRKELLIEANEVLITLYLRTLPCKQRDGFRFVNIIIITIILITIIIITITIIITMNVT